MLNGLQRAEIEQLALFCFNNITSNNDFALYLNAPELITAQELYSSITNAEVGATSDADVVYYLFNEFLKSSFQVKVELDFLKISKKSSLAAIKKQAIRAETMLQDMRTNGTLIAEYISVLVTINKFNLLIEDKETTQLQNNAATFFEDIRRIRAEILGLTELGLDPACLTVATMNNCYFSALTRFVKFNSAIILRSAFGDRNTELVVNLKQAYDRKLAALQANTDENNPELIQYLSILSDYSSLVLKWVNIKSITAAELAAMFTLLNKLGKNTADTQLYHALKIELFHKQLVLIAVNWILNIQEVVLTDADVKERTKFIGFWQQYLDKDWLSYLLKQLTMWQYQFAGGKLKTVLACKLRLEQDYADCLGIQELKDYYDFIASQTTERSLKLIGIWQDQELVTVRIHEQKLLGYVASKLDAFGTAWYYNKYDAEYTLEQYPNPRATTVIPIVPNIYPPVVSDTATSDGIEEDDLLPAEYWSNQDDSDNVSVMHEFERRSSTPLPFLSDDNSSDDEKTSLSPDNTSNDSSTEITSSPDLERENDTPPLEKNGTVVPRSPRPTQFL